MPPSKRRQHLSGAREAKAKQKKVNAQDGGAAEAGPSSEMAELSAQAEGAELPAQTEDEAMLDATGAHADARAPYTSGLPMHAARWLLAH